MAPDRLHLLVIYKVMKYRKVLIKYNAYFLKKSCISQPENIKKKLYFTAVKIKLYFMGEIALTSVSPLQNFKGL